METVPEYQPEAFRKGTRCTVSRSIRWGVYAVRPAESRGGLASALAHSANRGLGAEEMISIAHGLLMLFANLKDKLEGLKGRRFTKRDRSANTMLPRLVALSACLLCSAGLGVAARSAQGVQAEPCRCPSRPP
jgi:hypothetical protein